MRSFGTISAACLAATAFTALPSFAADPPTCQAVRIVDMGWTDIALTNTTAEVILTALGYAPKQTLLSLDVGFISLKDNNMDVFQGNWRPVQDDQYKAFFNDGSVEILGVNLEGAKFTLAVPQYVADAGVKTYDDLAAHFDQFGGKIYGIESGSNQPLLDMITAGHHGLGKWEVVESSEAGMLTQVQRSIERKDWVVFLGWEPHPMNLNFKMAYLGGGDVEYGPNFGGATVRTISRKGYATDCPNAAKFFSNLAFDLDYENVGMQKIMGDGMTADAAARAMIASDPAKLDKWLDGVTTLSGEPGLAAVKTALGL